MKRLSEWLDVSLGFARGIAFVVTLIVLLILGGIFRGTFITFIDKHELGYEYNMQSGEIKVLDRTGYFWVTPWVTVINTVDLRPMQIKIEANNRVLNAKLVRFRKEGLIQFIDMHGRDDYEQSKLADILKSYAYEDMGENRYSEKYLEGKYLFLDIMSGVSGSPTNTTTDHIVIPDSIVYPDSSWKDGN